MREREDAESLEVALIENMAREDLNPVEEARACAALVEELGLTREDVGRRVGRSRVAVSNLLRLLDLPDEALEMLESGALTEGHGRALLLAEDHGERRRLGREAAARGLVGPRARAPRPRRARRPERHTPPAAAPAACTRTSPPRWPTSATALGAALGADVRVRPDGDGCRVELRLGSMADALALAERLGARSAAR